MRIEENCPGPSPLELTASLLYALGEPHKGMRCVHIAGTNGKGSTAVFLERILRCAGYKTGLFTSPHIARYNERIRVNGYDISDDELKERMKSVTAAAEHTGISPNFFLRATAAAFEHFRLSDCDIVILETGLGGRLDPTNIIEAPELAIITRIGMDHTDLLGNTITQIAKEKAGIIKQGAQSIYISQCDEAARVLEQAGALRIEPLVEGEYELGIGGAYQLENAALAAGAARLLKSYDISEDDIREGLCSARFAARFELINESPPIVLDGAHNKQAAVALAKSIRMRWPSKKVVFVTGFMRDKAYEECIKAVSGLARAMVAVSPDGSRALDCEILARVQKKYCENAYPAASIEDGIRLALAATKADDIICAFGSLYIAAPIREVIDRLFLPRKGG